MKKSILFFVLCVYATVIFSQNITNTLGTNGLFTIRDGTNSFLTLDQSTGEMNILKTLRLENTTSTSSGIIFKGSDRFIHNFGTSNTFMGINAGNFTMTGSYNTAIGDLSLLSNEIGQRNTAAGTGSLYSNTNGSFNTAIGNGSLSANITGYFNTALGSQSLGSNIDGWDNTALGYQSLYENTSGNSNLAVGNKSLYFNTTSSGNTALGNLSLYSNETGENNTAVGNQSLFLNISGQINTALGHLAGYYITTGSNLMCLGYFAQPTSGDATNQITLGNEDITSLRCNVTTITSLSDARDKKNIEDLNLGIDFLMMIKPRQFNWDKRVWYDGKTSDGSKMKVEPTAGFIAQELDEAQTAGNAEWLNLVLKDNPEKWEAAPGNLLPVVIKAIQELKSENNILKNNNKKLSAEIESLKSMSEKLVKLEHLINELTLNKNTSLSLTK